MEFYKFIKIKGVSSKRIGFWVPHLYRLDFSWWELEIYGLRFAKERLNGWTIWWVRNEHDYNQAIEMLNDLKRTHVFEFKVTE